MNIKKYGMADELAIKDFELVIGFSLPVDYRKFLSSYNGGSFKDSSFIVTELNEELQLHVLYGLDVDKGLDLRTWYDEFEEDLIPNSIIIGHDYGSGIILLINDSDFKGVYYWDHSFDFPQSNEEENTYKIADSFEGFLNMLTE
ncbi:SMI1/KNR4 family protein [Metabacillus indicus]|uniref:SMI1/KNR4 family protein n=1 Tax=Metabacillus indicus TaxID=246786 RepID=UPI003CE7BD97